MQTLARGDMIVVALEPGEEIIESLLQVADQFAVDGGVVSGLGSTSLVEVAFFDPEKKEYVPRTFEEPMEIGNLVGNVSVLEGKRHVHLHISVSGPELIAFTGHLNRGVVGTACEIYVHKLGREVKRVRDAAAGFHPLDLS